MLKFTSALSKVERTWAACMQVSARAASTTKVWKKKYIRFRKPPWAPLAATKLHRVSQGRDWEGPEYEEMKERYNHFRTIKKSLYHYFKLEADKEQRLQEREEAKEEREVGRYGVRMEEVKRINDAWNEAIQKNRTSLDEEDKARVEKELEEVMKEMLKKGEETEMDAQCRILQALEQRHNFITDASQLDEAIDESLNRLTNHNFCIDIHGNRYQELSDGSLQGAPPGADGNSGGGADGSGGNMGGDDDDAGNMGGDNDGANVGDGDRLEDRRLHGVDERLTG